MPKIIKLLKRKIMNNIQTSAFAEIEKFNNYTTDLLMSLRPSFVFKDEIVEENINNALTDPPYKDLKKQLSIFQKNILNQISIEVNSNNITKIFDAYHPMFSMTRGMIKELNKTSKTDYTNFYSKKISKKEKINIKTIKDEIHNNLLTIKHFKDRGLSIQFDDYLNFIKDQVEICEVALDDILLSLPQLKPINKRETFGNIPKKYKEQYEVNYFSTDRIFYKPLKVTYNNEYIFYIYRPSVKYFLEELVSKYSKEEKKEVYNSISQGYNIGAKEYNNIFDLTETGAKRLLNELEKLQKIPFKETHVNFAELKKCGEIEGRINCIYGIMDSNSDLFVKDKNETIQDLTAMQIAAIHYYRYNYPLTNSNVKDFLNEINHDFKKPSHVVEQYNLWKSDSTRYKKGTPKEETAIQTIYEKIIPFLNDNERVKAEKDFNIFIENKNHK